MITVVLPLSAFAVIAFPSEILGLFVLGCAVVFCVGCYCCLKGVAVLVAKKLKPSLPFTMSTMHGHMNIKFCHTVHENMCSVLLSVLFYFLSNITKSLLYFMCSPCFTDFAYTLDLYNTFYAYPCKLHILQITLWEICVGEISYSL
jgi:hypothetical protein